MQVTVRLQSKEAAIMDAALRQEKGENPSQIVRTALREWARNHGIEVPA